MKNLFLFFVLVLFNVYIVKSQSDIIIWLDNSGSIDEQDWNEMSQSVDAIIHEILECNQYNRVAIVHYAGDTINGETESQIFIEDPLDDGAFTSNETEALNYNNRNDVLGDLDDAHEALKLIGKALDNVPDPLIVSNQTELNHNTTQNLVIFFFNDAYRDLPGTSLVNLESSVPNTDLAFLNYTNFKNNRGAFFVVTSVNPDSPSTTQDQQDAREANAVISSQSNTGNYIGDLEDYPSEPANNQIPRMYLNLTNFVISSQDLQVITSDLCFINEDCPDEIDLQHPDNDVLIGEQDNRQAESKIEATNIVYTGAGAIYHAGDEVILNPGFEAEFDSRFAAYIEGCTDDFVYRNGNSPTTPKQEIKEGLTIMPNPSNDFVKVQLKDDLFMRVTITSIERRVVLDKQVKSTKSMKVNVNNFQKGIYIVNVQSDDGKIYSSKLIKE